MPGPLKGLADVADDLVDSGLSKAGELVDEGVAKADELVDEGVQAAEGAIDQGEAAADNAIDEIGSEVTEALGGAEEAEQAEVEAAEEE